MSLLLPHDFPKEHCYLGLPGECPSVLEVEQRFVRAETSGLSLVGQWEGWWLSREQPVLVLAEDAGRGDVWRQVLTPKPAEVDETITQPCSHLNSDQTRPSLNLDSPVQTLLTVL